jgi:hypothetical protein
LAHWAARPPHPRLPLNQPAADRIGASELVDDIGPSPETERGFFIAAMRRAANILREALSRAWPKGALFASEGDVRRI